MKRHAHRIKDNRGNSIPQRVVFVDTETRWRDGDDGVAVHRLRLGVARYVVFDAAGKARANVPHRFESSASLWDFVERHTYRGTRLYLVSHNVHFDLKVLGAFRHLKRRGWKMTKFLLNGSMSIIDFRKDKKVIRIVDNLNWFKAKLADLGEEIGITKLTMPEKYATKEEWYTYCDRDVQVLVGAWEQWLQFVRAADLGVFAATLAGQSFNAYRHRFMPAPIYIHDRAGVIEDERASYHGGRVEAFRIGTCPEGQYYNLDINSMYPSVMLTGEYPTKYVKTIISPSLSLVQKCVSDLLVVAKCRIATDTPIYAAIKEGKLVFPVGRFTAWLTTREIEEAIKRGHLKAVETAHLYEKAVLFEKYVRFFYEARQRYKKAGQGTFAFMSKLLLNSLYGKFGQRNEEWQKIGEDDSKPDGVERIYDADNDRWSRFRTINGIVEEAVGFSEGYNSFPAIAAHITADARLKLWSLIEKAGRDNVVYCDTDSVFTTEEGYRRLSALIEPGALGKLDLKAQASLVEIHGLKDYRFGDEIKLKGIRKNAREIEPGLYEQERFEGLKGALRLGDLNSMRVYTVRKRLSRRYNKGVVQEDGTVRPYKLTEW